MTPKRIVIKKKISKPVTETYNDAPADIPQLRTRQLKSPKPPKIIDPSESADPPSAQSTIFKFYCIRCGQKLGAQAEWSGKEVNCTTCNSRIVIPDPPA